MEILLKKELREKEYIKEHSEVDGIRFHNPLDITGKSTKRTCNRDVSEHEKLFSLTSLKPSDWETDAVKHFDFFANCFSW